MERSFVAGAGQLQAVHNGPMLAHGLHCMRAMDKAIWQRLWRHCILKPILAYVLAHWPALLHVARCRQPQECHHDDRGCTCLWRLHFRAVERGGPSSQHGGRGVVRDAVGIAGECQRSGGGGEEGGMCWQLSRRGADGAGGSCGGCATIHLWRRTWVDKWMRLLLCSHAANLGCGCGVGCTVIAAAAWRPHAEG